MTSRHLLLIAGFSYPVLQAVLFRWFLHQGLGLRFGWGGVLVDADLIVPALTGAAFCIFFTLSTLPLFTRWNRRYFWLNAGFAGAFLLVNLSLHNGFGRWEGFFRLGWWALFVGTMISAVFCFLSPSVFLEKKQRRVFLPCLLLSLSTILANHLFLSFWNQTVGVLTTVSCGVSDWLMGGGVDCRVVYKRSGEAVIRLFHSGTLGFVAKPCGGLDGLLFVLNLSFLFWMHKAHRLGLMLWLPFSALALIGVFWLNALRIGLYFAGYLYLKQVSLSAAESYKWFIHANGGWLLYVLYGLGVFGGIAPLLYSEKRLLHFHSLRLVGGRVGRSVWLLGLAAFFSPQAVAHSVEVRVGQIRKALPREFSLLGEETVREAILAFDSLGTRAGDPPQVANGRLTLTSGTAVTTSNVTAATTVYYTPYEGNKIALYNGTRWVYFTFSELSVSVPSTTVTPFDIFAYNNSGTVALETVNWSSDTSRATSLTLQDGVWVKSGATTRRYLGTARTTSVSGQTEDSVSKRYLWNAHNRLPRKLLAQSTTDSWTYNTASWRAANNSTTVGVTRVEYVAGLSAESVRLSLLVPYINNNTATTNHVGGIGINSTSVNSADLFNGNATTHNATGGGAQYSGVPAEGYSYAQWLEYGIATGTSTVYSVLADYRQGGMVGEIWQ